MKYYLECQNCGFANEVSSEFLTFCDQCKKKLLNNFREWKKHHPEGNINQFTKEECKPESAIDFSDNVAIQAIPEKRIWLKVGITLLLVLVLFFTFFSNSIKESQLYLYLESVGNSIFFTTNWDREVYGDYGLSLESPFKLEDISMPVPAQHSQLLEDLQAFNSNPENESRLVAVSTRFNPKIGSVNLQASISSFMGQVQGAPGISNFKVKQSEISISGIPGYQQNGSFFQEGREMAFISVGLTRGLILWQVMVVFDPQDTIQSEGALRIINSIEILYNSEA